MERAVERLQRVRAELRALFFERDEVIDGMLCALLARAHVLLIGPPGTAKSLLARELCERIDGARYFQWLLTKFTTPEEIFGAVSLKGLENDEFRRVTTGKLPEAHVAFLDEVFKASSSILNTLLTIMNERTFFNGRSPVEVPLITLIGASNELPGEEDELEALYDRFLVRYVVGYIKEDFRFLKMLQSGFDSPARSVLTFDDLLECQREAAAVTVPPHVLKLIARIRRDLAKKGLSVSDRRYKQSLDLLRAKAYLEGREAVDDEDLPFLENVLWREPEERQEVEAVVYQALHGYRDRARELLMQARELASYAKRRWESEEMAVKAHIEAQTKLKTILERMDALLDECRERGKPTAELEGMRAEVERIRKDIVDTILASGETRS